jgi:hypothetical protein
MSNGFISFEMDKVTYLNKYMSEKFKKWYECESHLERAEECK